MKCGNIWKLMVNSGGFRCVSAGMLVVALTAACLSSSLYAQQSAKTATEALQKAHVIDRLAEAIPAEHKGTAPSFVLDPAWPKPLPHHWVIGDVGGIAVDKHDHVWVYHRPRSLSSTDTGMQGVAGKDAKGNPISPIGFPRPFGPLNGCCMPAPSVLEFDQAGNLLHAWGGPGDPGFLDTKCREQDGCFWPAREHGIYVDQNDFVYLAGNGQARNFHGQYPWAPKFGNDSHILKFKSDGTFVMQIGSPGAKGPNSNDTNGGVNGTPQMFWPADMVVDPKTNLMYIADGYGNRRVLIVDAATGKYVGHFGAYGQNPVVGENGGVAPPSGGTGGASAAAAEDVGEGIGTWPGEYRAGQMKPKFFRSPVHCAKLANDGLLYVCDRSNNRVQIFRASEVGRPCSNPDGEANKCGFVGEIHVAPQTSGGTSGTVNFSTDPKQTCMYIADLGNDALYVINRENLTELSRFGGGGRQAGEFHWPHMVTVDSDGNIYVGEVDGASRVQKFLRYGATGCSGTGNSDVGQYTE
jgi:DNA-binding beta-propeller fold protein YncE